MAAAVLICFGAGSNDRNSALLLDASDAAGSGAGAPTVSGSTFSSALVVSSASSSSGNSGPRGSSERLRSLRPKRRTPPVSCSSLIALRSACLNEVDQRSVSSTIRWECYLYPCRNNGSTRTHQFHIIGLRADFVIDWHFPSTRSVERVAATVHGAVKVRSKDVYLQPI